LSGLTCRQGLLYIYKWSLLYINGNSFERRLQRDPYMAARPTSGRGWPDGGGVPVVEHGEGAGGVMRWWGTASVAGSR
jgi:hypothetical protein